METTTRHTTITEPVRLATGQHARLHRMALLGTLIAWVASAVWLLAPSTMPFVDGGEVLLSTVLPDRWMGLPLLVAASLGTAALVAGERLPRAVLGIVGAVEVLTLLGAYQGFGTVPVFGYTLAMFIPLVVLGVGVLAVVRMPKWRLPILAVATVAVTAGVWSGVLTWSNVAGTLGTVVGLVLSSPRFYVTLLSVAVGLAWVALVAASFPRPLARGTDWVTRHRRGFTIGAIVCAVPYAFARLMWLTPWPLEDLLDIGPPLELTVSVRLWGLALGGACILGAVLTSGLISHWGEVFPRWMPGLAGRPVPIALAAVPGFTVATAFLAGAPGMFVGSSGSWVELVTMAVFFPFLPWGVLLALAVWGYVGHRLESGSSTVVRNGRATDQ